MPALVDLHIHSDKSSDGELSPAEIIALAVDYGLLALSIADHDTLAAYPEALELGDKSGLEVIPSIELTTGFKGREFHLLCPFVSWTSSLMAGLVADVAGRRITEAKKRVAKIQELGMDLEWSDVEGEAGSFPPVGVSIALAFLKKARRRKDPVWKKYYDGKRGIFRAIDFYNDYFKKGKPAYVTRRLIDLPEVLELVRRAGAVPVLAHPGAYFVRATPEDLEELRGLGLEGLEVFSTYHDDAQREYYLDVAGNLNLVPTAGSDFHGSVKPHIPFGSLNHGDYTMVERLKQRRP